MSRVRCIIVIDLSRVRCIIVVELSRVRCIVVILLSGVRCIVVVELSGVSSVVSPCRPAPCRCGPEGYSELLSVSIDGMGAISGCHALTISSSVT